MIRPEPVLPAYDRDNVFARILRGEAPCTKVYEDEFALAFLNIYPCAFQILAAELEATSS